MDADGHSPVARIVKNTAWQSSIFPEGIVTEGDATPAVIPSVAGPRNSPSPSHPILSHRQNHPLQQVEPLLPLGDPSFCVGAGPWNHRNNDFTTASSPNSFEDPFGFKRAPHSNPDPHAIQPGHHERICFHPHQHAIAGRVHGARWEIPSRLPQGSEQKWPGRSNFSSDFTATNGPASEAKSDGFGQPNLVRDVGRLDIVCGRGIGSYIFPGNAWFRDLVEEHQVEYLACRRADKPSVARNIIGKVRARGGRFLKRTKQSQRGEQDKCGWIEIEGSRVYEKVCQALREGAPKIREQILRMSRPKNLEKENSDKKK